MKGKKEKQESQWMSEVLWFGPKSEPKERMGLMSSGLRYKTFC
jgi:hypothetical protein